MRNVSGGQNVRESRSWKGRRVVKPRARASASRMMLAVYSAWSGASLLNLNHDAQEHGPPVRQCATYTSISSAMLIPRNNVACD